MNVLKLQSYLLTFLYYIRKNIQIITTIVVLHI